MTTHSLSAEPGDDQAWLEAFQKELHYVHRILRWRLGASSSEVEDLAQEVFLALRQSWSEYDSRRPLRPYLYGIAFRIAAAHHRKRRREVVLAVVEASDQGPGPDDALQTKQARAVVRTALERIPPARRAVLIMHDLNEVPMADVASVLSIPRFTAYSRLRKARSELNAAIRRVDEQGRAIRVARRRRSLEVVPSLRLVDEPQRIARAQDR